MDLVSLSVTVTDSRTSSTSADLTRDDFVVLENGGPQAGHVLCKDWHSSGVGAPDRHQREHGAVLATAQEAAVGFVRQIGPTDLATIIDFDSRVQTAQGLTSDQEALEQRDSSDAADGSTALYNAVYIALKELAKLPP